MEYYYEQALTIAREIGDRSGEGMTLSQIGSAYGALGKYQQELKCYSQAVTIAREIGDQRGEAVILVRIGSVYGVSGQHQQVLEYSEQALTIAREIGDLRSEGGALGNIGLAYSALEQYEEAAVTLKESLNICTTLGTLGDLWVVQQGLASVEVVLNEPESAIIHYVQALDTIEDLRAGLVEKEQKLSFMQDKLSVYDKLIRLLQDLHQQYPNKGYDRKALEIFERKQGRVFLEEMGKSGARRFAGLPEESRQQEVDLENRLEQTRKQLVDERSKPITEQNKDLIQNIEEQEKNLIADQDVLQEQIKTSYPDYYALKYPKPATLSDLQENVLQLGELMLVYGVMEEKTVLWVVGEDFQMYTLPVGEEELSQKVDELRKAMRIEFLTSRAPKIVKDLDIHNASSVEVGYDLYTLLIPEEVRPLLTARHTLHIVPTGPLYGLPFEGLMTKPPPNPPSARSGQTSQEENVAYYLIEDVPISYLSSASLLKILREAQARRKDETPYAFLAFAYPVYETFPSQEVPSYMAEFQELRNQTYRDLMRGEFAELPETAEEARDIATLLNAPEESEPLQLRENASRSNLFDFNSKERLDDYSYVLFATHGVLPGEVSYLNQPALVLSYPEQDGYLTMADVFGLKFNAQLISLSACNTGRGQEVQGEGVRGLTRAFMYAGTPAIAVTLWSVETFSAKELDVGMFEHLKAGQPPAHAIRSIKLDMLRGKKGEEYRHPYYWAPFVVFGDGMFTAAGPVEQKKVEADALSSIVEQQLRTADAYFDEKQFLIPEEESAFAIYQDVLSHNPANRHAREKVREIAKAYKTWGDRAYSQKDTDKIQTYYQRYLFVAEYILETLKDQSISQEFQDVQQRLESFESP